VQHLSSTAEVRVKSLPAPPTTDPSDSEISQWGFVEQIVAENPAVLTPASVHWHLRHRSVNGLDKVKAVRRLGKRLALHRARYGQWLASGAEAAP
jgi:hypothetical protein